MTSIGSELLTVQERSQWESLVQAESKLPVHPKGKRPSAEVVACIREHKQKKKSFLEQLSIEARATLENRQQPPLKSSNSRNSNSKSDWHDRILPHLADFAIRDEANQVMELLDIGINTQTRANLVDFHRQMQRSFASGVTKVILTGCSLKSSLTAMSMCSKFHKLEGICKMYCTAGVHPHEAASLLINPEDALSEIDPLKMEELKSMISSPFNVSVGECGLDYDRMFSPLQVQKKIFAELVHLAVVADKPLFVHLRERDNGEPLGAFNDALEILAASKINPQKVCVHCFTGESNDLDRLVDAGFFIGLTGFIGIANRAKDTIHAVSRKLPLDRLLIETDAPFMMPDKEWIPKELEFSKSRQNEPCCLPAVCRAVAKSLEVSPEAVASASWKNAEQLYNLCLVDSNLDCVPKSTWSFDKKELKEEKVGKEIIVVKGVAVKGATNKKLSHLVSKVLRHSALKEGLPIRSDGFLSLDVLKQVARFRGFVLDDYQALIQNCDKQRFALREEDGNWFIRANQGHSMPHISTEELLERIDLSNIDSCIHGTYYAAWEVIQTQGLSRMNRNHIHFAKSLPDKANDVISGMRSSCQVIIHLDTKEAKRKSLPMFVSANGVLLSPGLGDGIIPCSLFKKVTDRETGRVLYTNYKS